MKHWSVTVAKPPTKLIWPAQVPPELKLKLPVGLHAVIEVGGGAGAEYVKHPGAIKPSIAKRATGMRMYSS